MGFFSRAKDAGGYIVNFKVGQWIGLDQLRNSSKRIIDVTKTIYTPEQAEHTETFEEALKRLNLTEEEVDQRRIEFTRLMIIYMVIALCLFAYSVFIVYKFKNFLGFFMGFSITIFALSHAFRYHFWIFQIKHKKLGCTIRDWFLDNH